MWRRDGHGRGLADMLHWLLHVCIIVCPYHYSGYESPVHVKWRYRLGIVIARGAIDYGEAHE